MKEGNIVLRECLTNKLYGIDTEGCQGGFLRSKGPVGVKTGLRGGTGMEQRKRAFQTGGAP